MSAKDPLPDKSRSATSLVLVGLQICLSATIVLAHGIVWPRPGGLILAAIGILLGSWAIAAMKPSNVSILPDVQMESPLVTRGPYCLIRHPMYTGLLSLCLGIVVSQPSILRVVVWLCLVATLVVKARYEEKLLALSFPEYAAYKSNTWPFIPYLI